MKPYDSFVWVLKFFIFHWRSSLTAVVTINFHYIKELLWHSCINNFLHSRLGFQKKKKDLRVSNWWEFSFWWELFSFDWLTEFNNRDLPFLPAVCFEIKCNRIYCTWPVSKRELSWITAFARTLILRLIIRKYNCL